MFVSFDLWSEVLKVCSLLHVYPQHVLLTDKATIFLQLTWQKL